MRARHVLSIAFGVFMTASFLKPCETYGFMMGGSGQGKDCEIFIPATKTMLPNGEELPDNYDVVLTNEDGETETVPFMVMFNKDCHKVKNMPHAVEHIKNRTNLFFLREHGDMVIYSTVYQGYDKLQRTTSAGDLYNNRVLNEGGKINRFGRLFITYSVPKNDTSCGYKASNNNPICEKDKTYYDWGHALDSYTKANIEKLTEAIKEKDQKTIDALTGEFEYIGYSTDGTPINNPYFPSEYPVRYKNGKVVKEGTGGSGKANAYPWIENPWNWGTPKTEYDDIDYYDKYLVKKEAIVRLMEQENMGKTVDYWMKRLSLKNNADTQSAVFEGREDGEPFYDSQSGTWKQLYNLVLLEAPESALQNVGIMEMTIYDGEDKIASFTRDVIGYEQGSVYMKKENGKAVVLEGGKEYNLVIKVTNGSQVDISTSHLINAKITSDDKSVSKEEQEIEKQITKGSTSLGVNESTPIKTTITMPSVNGEVDIFAELDETTYNQVNSNRVDDTAKVKVQVKTPTGDVSVCKIAVFEKGGKTPLLEIEKYGKTYSLSQLVQDREYDVEYSICYSGSKINEKQDIKVEGTLSTSGQYHQEISLNRTINASLDKTIVFRETIRVSKPEIKTNIKISTTNKNINTNTKNDSGSATFSNLPNISLTDLKITPGKINFKPLTGCHTVTVSYNLTVSGQATNATFNTQTRIVIGGKEYTVTDRVKKGTAKYTHNLEYCFQSGETNQTKKVVAEANKNQAMYESSISDNKKEIDWIGGNDNTQLTGCPIDGIVKNEVKWDQTYTIDTIDVWYENGRLMQEVVKSETKTVTNQTESFKITSIQMRSKLQQDLKLGDKGWIEVLGLENGQLVQVNTPKIKAGYGFEIKIEAEYTTNAFDNDYQKIDTKALEEGKKQTIQVVSAGSHKSPNLVNDFYLNIGGKTINVGTGLDLNIEKSGTNNSTNVFEVTITPHNSPNTSEVNDTRLYVSENTADDMYQAKFFTPAIIGLTSRSDKENTVLCDEIEIDFEVVGSVYDDLNTHIN